MNINTIKAAVTQEVRITCDHTDAIIDEALAQGWFDRAVKQAEKAEMVARLGVEMNQVNQVIGAMMAAKRTMPKAAEETAPAPRIRHTTVGRRPAFWNNPGRRG